MSKEDGGPAFPQSETENGHPFCEEYGFGGMTLRDYFAAAALQNPTICTGIAADHEIAAWFGKSACGITRQQIAAFQAGSYADAMIAERAK